MYIRNQAKPQYLNVIIYERDDNKMKKLVSLLFVMGLLFALSACGTADDPTPITPEATPTPAAEATPEPLAEVEGALEVEEDAETVMLDHITIGVGGAVFASITPFRNNNNQHHQIVRFLYERLLYLTPNGYVRQGARSFEVAEDGRTWTVEIYDYIYDSAGNHITAADVVWFIEESMERGMRPVFRRIESVQQTGDYTFEVVMDDDVADTFEIILISTFLISREAYEASTNGMATELISTSKFQVTDFIPDATITFTIRDDHWQDPELTDPALVSNIRSFTVMNIPEASQQQIALETGIVDAFVGLVPTVAGAFENNPAFHFATSPSNTGLGLYFSGAESSMVAYDVYLRRAIAYAIDAAGILAGALNGFGEVMTDITPRTSAGFLDEWLTIDYFPFSTERAAYYLAKSNYNGEPLSIMASGATNERVSILIQAYLQAIGVNVALDIRDTALFAASSQDGNNFDMLLVNAGNGLVNQWGNRFDMNAFELGDAQSRRDPVLTELLHYTFRNANFVPENKERVRQYLADNMYAYGIVLGHIVSVANVDLGLAGTTFDITGLLDLPASVFTQY